jgi:hypothetical protein
MKPRALLHIVQSAQQCKSFSTAKALRKQIALWKAMALEQIPIAHPFVHFQPSVCCGTNTSQALHLGTIDGPLAIYNTLGLNADV